MRGFKDIWLEQHERLVAEYLDNHPGVSWEAAYDLTAEMVDEAAADAYGSMLDGLEMQAEARLGK